MFFLLLGQNDKKFKLVPKIKLKAIEDVKKIKRIDLKVEERNNDYKR